MENEIKKMKNFLVVSGLMFLLSSICTLIITTGISVDMITFLSKISYALFIIASICLMLAGNSRK